MTNRTLILMIALSKAPISISALDRFLNLTIVKNVPLIFMHGTCQKYIKEKKKNIFDK